MPRETRKEREERMGVSPQEPPISEQAAWFDREPTKEVLHMRCPCCGLMSPEDGRTLKSGKTIGFGGGPYYAVQRLQKFGGSIPGISGDMAGRPGLLWWDPEEPLSAAQRKRLLRQLYEAFEAVEKGDQ